MKILKRRWTTLFLVSIVMGRNITSDAAKKYLVGIFYVTPEELEIYTTFMISYVCEVCICYTPTDEHLEEKPVYH